MYPRNRYEAALKGAFFIGPGTHCGEFSETRVVQRITGRNHPGVAIARCVDFIETILFRQLCLSTSTPKRISG